MPCVCMPINHFTRTRTAKRQMLFFRLVSYLFYFYRCSPAAREHHPHRIDNPVRSSVKNTYPTGEKNQKITYPRDF